MCYHSSQALAPRPQPPAETTTPALKLKHSGCLAWLHVDLQRGLSPQRRFETQHGKLCDCLFNSLQKCLCLRCVGWFRVLQGLLRLKLWLRVSYRVSVAWNGRPLRGHFYLVARPSYGLSEKLRDTVTAKLRTFETYSSSLCIAVDGVTPER